MVAPASSQTPVLPQSSLPPSVLFRGGQVVLPDRTAHFVSVRIFGEHIEAVLGPDVSASPGEQVVELRGATLAPGFIDLQCNGALGIDLASQPERLCEFASLLPRWGVTSVLPTIITSPPHVVENALSALRNNPQQSGASRILGLHLEGPFLNPLMAGAHPSSYLRSPDSTPLPTWTREEVPLVTLAPELPGAEHFITEFHNRGIVIAAGHTAATDAQLAAAQALGVSAVTHLFNAMNPMHHRNPGVIGHVFNNDSLVASIIVDGIHVAPSVVRSAWRLLGERLVIVSDAVAALGMQPGQLRLGELDLIVDADSVRLRNGTLAGSMLSVDAAVRNLMRFTGATLAEAVFAASGAPAALLGRSDIGAIAAGRRADLVVLSEDATVLSTWIDGKQVWAVTD
jgi:N-acetylglucosamine-6-phosphate deacetylase